MIYRSSSWCLVMSQEIHIDGSPWLSVLALYMNFFRLCDSESPAFQNGSFESAGNPISGAAPER